MRGILLYHIPGPSPMLPLEFDVGQPAAFQSGLNLHVTPLTPRLETSLRIWEKCRGKFGSSQTSVVQQLKALPEHGLRPHT